MGNIKKETNVELNRLIDHTILKPDATEKDIVKLCREALEFKFAAVCVNPIYVKLAHEQLKNTDVKVCTVVGFPLGANTAAVKSFEAKEAVASGADEIDMVINISYLKERNEDEVINDIAEVVKTSDGRIVKVIIETALLSEEEKILACKCAVKAGAHFVKTSTGFAKKGATVDDIKLMRQVVGKDFGVKASGGIKTFEDALKMIKAGANRIGTSSSLSIVKNIS